MPIWDYFTDAVLRGPTLGCMLMCLSAALIGVLVFLRKQSLLGEALSHAAYPGVIVGVLVAAFFPDQETVISFCIMGGAFVSSLLGLLTLRCLERKMKVKSDAALCFMLASFFGVGLTLASRIQFTHTALYNQIQVYLYGQAATMTDTHIIIYGILAFIVLALLIFFYKELQLMAFDSSYAKSLGIPVGAIDSVVFVLIVLAVIIGIRSVGVVLMSAMLIAPAAAARQYTHKLYLLFLLAAVFGILSGFFGNYFSVEISHGYLVLPTGPSIVMVAAALGIFSLLFAPERGWILRLARVMRFKYKCMTENVLKSIWRIGPNAIVTFEQIAQKQGCAALTLHLVMTHLISAGWVDQVGRNAFQLTGDGRQRAEWIVRLHRLWEVYLADYLGVGVERVHRSAEEMEHIITPELEAQLTQLLENPKSDPHHQPIPSKDRL